MNAQASTQLASSPYPGLRPFGADETEIFFGREAQTDQLLDRLRTSRFLAIVGSSGCGKSSLVRAGMIAALRTGLMCGAGSHWRIALMHPGARPLWNLAAALAGPEALGLEERNGATGIALADATLRRGSLGLQEILQQGCLPQGANLLLVIDQFEEIFRFEHEAKAQDAEAFVALLLASATLKDFPVYVALTMRTNSLDKCARFRGLPEAINDGLYLTPRLSREQIRRAIVGPARVFDADVDEALATQLVNQVGTDPDQLPLLQHALMRMWQHMEKRVANPAAAEATKPTITAADYAAVGSISMALSNHGDECYESLPGQGKVVERLFRALTERDANGSENRRALAFDHLCAVTGADTASVAQVVERFRRPDTAFLMPPPAVELNSNPVIDISHESLIRQWQKLREWSQTEYDSRIQLLRLVKGARLYEQGEGDLWQGRNLERALQWQKKEQPTPSWASLCTGKDASDLKKIEAFLAESALAVRCEEKHGRYLLWGLRALALIVVIGAVVFAVNRDHLQQQAKSRELTSRALLEFEQDPATSARRALVALDLDAENSGAESALRQALATLEVAHAERIVTFDDPITDARFTSDRSRLAVASGKQVSILDGRTYEIIANPLVRDEPVTKVWLLGRGRLLVTLTEDGQWQIQSVDGGPIKTLTCEGDGNIYTLTVSSDERYIAAGCNNGEIARWNANESGVQQQLSLVRGSEGKATVTAVSFSADSNYLASGDADGNVTVWKLGEANPWIGAGVKGSKASPIRHLAAIRDIAFYPTDSSLLATASDDLTAAVWRLDMRGRRVARDKQGNQWTMKLQHDHPVVNAHFVASRRDTPLLMTIADKRAYFWQGQKSQEVRRHDDWINDASVSDDGELAVSASSDGTARVWSTRFRMAISVLRGHRESVTRAFFDSKGQVVTTSRDGRLLVWRLNVPLLLHSKKQWMLSARFDPSGRRTAICGELESLGNECRIVDLKDAKAGRFSREVLLDAVNADAVGLVSWSADGRFLIGITEMQDISQRYGPVVWDTQSGRNVTPNWFGDWRVAGFGAGSGDLLTVNDEGAVAVWNADALGEDEPQPKLRIPPNPQRWRWWAELSTDSRWIAAIEGDRISLFDTTNANSAPRILEGHRGDIKTAKFSRDGKWLVTASGDRTARIWRIELSPGEPETSVELIGHTGALSSAAFNHDGSQVVTSSADRTIRVWDAQRGLQLAVLRCHGDSVNEVQFDGDGRYILSASDDGTVKLGQCESCNQTITQLRARVRDEAIIPRHELDRIEADTEEKVSYYSRVLAIFTGKR